MADQQEEARDPLAGLPETFNIGHAASMVLAVLADPVLRDTAAHAAVDVWECLTGLRGEAAIEAASIAAGRTVTAARTPF